MPIYEYRCNNCGRKVSLLVRGSSSEPVCTACGSKELSRLFSTFAMKRPDTAVYDDILSDPYLMRGLKENNPRALAKWSRKMSDAMGEKRDGLSEEWLGRMEHGQMPSQQEISKAQEEYLSKEPE